MFPLGDIWIWIFIIIIASRFFSRRQTEQAPRRKGLPFPWPAPDLPPIGRHPTPAAGPISLPTSQELRPPAQPVEAPVVDPVEKEGRFPEQPMVNRAADGSMPSGLKSVVNEVTGWPAELVNNPVVAGIVLAEVLALPRSRRPFRPSYRR